MYLGNQPALSYTSFAKQDFTTSATTSYTLDNSVANENELALFINFVRQEPTTAYTASGTSLTLTSATSASDDMYCVFLGKAVQTVNPPNASVGTSQIADLAVTSGKLASGVLPTNTPSFLAYLTSNTEINDTTMTKVQCDTERFDTDSAYDNSTNYRFTPQESGKYFVYGAICFDGTQELYRTTVSIWKNGSNYHTVHNTNPFSSSGYGDGGEIGVVVEMNGSTDYVELYTYVDTSNSTTGNLSFNAAGTIKPTFFGAYKLIG